MSYRTGWSDVEESTLRSMLADNCSFRQIAAALGRTRNQVSGKVFRLGLCSKVVRVKKPKALRRVFRADFKRGMPLPVERFDAREINVPESERKMLHELTAQECHWPYGDGPFSFCARPAVPDHAYCADHKQLAVK